MTTAAEAGGATSNGYYRSFLLLVIAIIDAITQLLLMSLVACVRMEKRVRESAPSVVSVCMRLCIDGLNCHREFENVTIRTMVTATERNQDRADRSQTSCQRFSPFAWTFPTKPADSLVFLMLTPPTTPLKLYREKKTYIYICNGSTSYMRIRCLCRWDTLVALGSNERTSFLLNRRAQRTDG